MRKQTNSVRLAAHLSLIDQVYAAALDEIQWASLAPQIAKTFDSPSTTVLVQRTDDGSGEILSMTENVQSGIADYVAHFRQCDIWVQRALERLSPGQVGNSEDLLPDSEFRETEFYRDWCRYLDVFYVVGAVFPTGVNQLGVLGIHRARHAGTYDTPIKLRVQHFLVHLQRALRIRDQLSVVRCRQRLSEEALERCGTAVILVTADASIVYANALAEELLAVGRSVRSSHGRLTAALPADAARLLQFIREACTRKSPSTEGMLWIQRPPQTPLSALVAPFAVAWPGLPCGTAAVFIRDPLTSTKADRTFRMLFGLTPTEARIARALTQGKSIEEIAQAHRANPATVRKQMKSVLAKTGTRRQAECVAVLLRSAASLALSGRETRCQGPASPAGLLESK